MAKNVPITKKEIANNEMDFDWKFGHEDTNIVVENAKLNVQILRYAILSADKKFLYDTISIREPINNTVMIIRNQKKELGLVWEWRPAPAKWFWACVRGFGDPRDKNNIATAKREMIEEIGRCKIVDNQNLGVLFQNTTFYENPVGLILFDVDAVEGRANQQEGIMEFRFFRIEEIKSMIREGGIEDTFTLSAFMKFFLLEGLV